MTTVSYFRPASLRLPCKLHTIGLFLVGLPCLRCKIRSIGFHGARETLGEARRGQESPGGETWRAQGSPEGARRDREKPGEPRRAQGRDQDSPGGETRRAQGSSGGARRDRESPGEPREGQESPGEARRDRQKSRRAQEERPGALRAA